MKSLPALKIALFLAIGIIIGNLLVLEDTLIFLCSTAVGILVTIAFFKSRWCDFLVYLSLFLVGVLLSGSINLIRYSAENLPQGEILLCGELVEVTYQTGERTVSVFEPDWFSSDAIAFQELNGKLRLITDNGEFPAVPGSRLLLSGEIKPYPPKRNPGGRDLKLEFAYRGIMGWMKPHSIVPVQIADPSAANKVSCALTGAIARMLPPRQAGHLSGMLLGQKSALPTDIRDDFRRSGLYHLLAVSGLHIGFLLAVLTLFINPFVRNLHIRRFLLLALMWGFVIVTGSNTPTLRAALMISLFLLSHEIKRLPNRWNLLGAAALIILLFAPHQLFTPGFQLSFTAMAGVLLAIDVRENLFFRRTDFSHWNGNFWRFIENYAFIPLLISVCTVTFTAPVLIAHFGGYAPVSILLNLIAIPLTGVVFFLGWLAIIFDFIAGIPATAISGAIELGLKSLQWLAQLGSTLPGSFAFGHGGLLSAIVLSAALLGFILYRTWKLRIIVVGGALAFFLLLPVVPTDAHLRVEFLDISQGDAAFVHFPEKANVLIDCGSADAAKFEVIPSLKKRGFHRIDALIISHFDSDHAGGACEIMNFLKVKRLIVNQLDPEDKLGRMIIQTARSKDIPVRQISLGDTICILAGAKCLALWPPRNYQGDDNDRSLVLKLSHGDVDFLFTGDIGWKQERILTTSGSYLNCEVLKIPHHGSRYSSDVDFLNMVKPEHAVISCGKYNPYGHPAAEVMSNLQEMKTFVHRTDMHNAAVYKSNGRDLWSVDWR
ncbi:DNA internalization-related competence protein ComEC/Rec2 [candidate division LCP-89 bacterium B3_LCP]|uniref:DNA internalization-related competence protein ComEC/Rec2 n=1 Tax=candidate division LCP-89 bacterium B3_LCP TaxID=2012998 RepID=A0A532UZB3_UNCL8|nr:MAG: DNA internalization-related competence protein ComEC/Rec2 [candidate division LCP-89 bacterium B3_LCP]